MSVRDLLEVGLASRHTSPRDYETYAGNSHHSVRADVLVVRDKTTGATDRLARIRKALSEADKNLLALFRRMDENRQELAEEGLVANHALSPTLEGAYRAYLRAESQEPGAKILTEATEPPLPPVDEDNQ